MCGEISSWKRLKGLICVFLEIMIESSFQATATEEIY